MPKSFEEELFELKMQLHEKKPENKEGLHDFINTKFDGEFCEGSSDDFNVDLDPFTLPILQ